MDDMDNILSIFIHRTIWIEIGGYGNILFLSIGQYGRYRRIYFKFLFFGF